LTHRIEQFEDEVKFYSDRRDTGWKGFESQKGLECIDNNELKRELEWPQGSTFYI